MSWYWLLLIGFMAGFLSHKYKTNLKGLLIQLWAKVTKSGAKV